MAIYLEYLLFKNRAPFDNFELTLPKNSISVFTGVNGKGKTTILSHIADAFYEMAKITFPQSFENKEGKLYRVSSTLDCINFNKPSIVYLRFDCNGEKLDYLDIRNKCTDAEYNDLVTIINKIDYSNFKSQLEESNYAKVLSNNFPVKKINILFSNNIITYFPSYRFEQPGYLNDVYKTVLNYRIKQNYSGYLKNPIEGISNLQGIANWIMDLVLDVRSEQLGSAVQGNAITFSNVNSILSSTLTSKLGYQVRFGIGPRSFGGTRLQIVKQSDNSTAYPSIFTLSSGESSLLCMFSEILRQSDNIHENMELENINGLVLIDEIDKHLHIKLQKEVLPKLLKMFKNVQFILTTHSPFLEFGLAEDNDDRTNIYDLDNNGLKTNFLSTIVFNEVYEMIISKNNNFKKQLDSIKDKINSTNNLQIVSEGKNIEHIRKAIHILDDTLVSKVNLISGCEDRSGSQQLKNAFEVMKNGNFSCKFLFVWDCDASTIVDSITETSIFYKYCFLKNEENTVATKGIENLYNIDLFSDDMYDTKVHEKEYGGTLTERAFSKQKFLEKILAIDEPSCFNKYLPLIEKIQQLI